MKLTTSSFDDLHQIKDWIAADPWHQDQNQPEWWLTGNGLLSFVVIDDDGPIAFVRLDREDGKIRLHTQFGPKEEVSRDRLIPAMLEVIPLLIGFSKKNGTAIIYKSTNESLIRFMSNKFKFAPVRDDDYVLMFEGLCAAQA